MSKRCLIHYPNISIANKTKFTDIDKDRYEKLRKAKSDRLTLGGLYITEHRTQLDAVPIDFVEGHHYHLEYYKQFTRALADLKKKQKTRADQNVSNSNSCISTSTSSTERPKRSTEKSEAGRFPLYCIICKTVTKRKRTRDEEEKEQPTKFTLEESVETFRKAMVAKQDKEMMDAIDGVDIMLKNFRKHESCWRQYVSVLRKVEKVKTEDPYDVVRMEIQETVLGRKICMSLDTLLELPRNN